MIDVRAALQAAYLERRADLLRFFTLRLRSAAAAEDLVQEIFVRIATVDPNVQVLNPVGYLYRIGSNLMLDRLKQDRRAAARDADWRGSQTTTLGREDVANVPPPDRAIAARQRLETIIALVRTLPETTQYVFRRHKLEGMSHREVAHELGISRSAVEKHMMAALKLLSRHLE